MIGKLGEGLGLAKLDELCQERTRRHQQAIRDEINGRLDEIARMSNPPLEGITRPYGVSHEGQAYDVWYQILKRINDPSEVENLWNVSGIFRDLLRGKFIETKLPEIVKLILDKLPGYLLPRNAEENWRMSTILKLRMISSQCRISLEDMANSEKCDLACLRLETTEKVEQVSGTLVETPSIAQSFFPCKLIIDDKKEDVRFGLGQFHQAITFFLKLAGHRIHFLNYMSALDTLHNLYDCLREWMKLMPNLTHFTLRQYYRMDDVNVVPALEDIEPFPNLPKLQCYEEISIELPAVYVQRILEACPVIEDIRLLEAFDLREHSPQMLQTLGHLKSLQIYPTRSLMDQHHLPWKLKKLKLCRENVDESEERVPNITIASCRLFNFLKQFESTLQHLEVEMVDVIDPCCADGYLELRNLKTLKMELHESFENLNFLLFAERLQVLHLTIEKDFGEDVDPDVELWKVVERSFFGKSIWKVFPYLIQIRLETGKLGSWKTMVEEFRTAQ